MFVSCIFFMVCWAHCVKAEVQVHIMSTNKEVILSCITTSPWFLCVWEGPYGERACTLRNKISVHGNSLCGEQDRLEVRGNSSICSLVIHQPCLSDHGEWTCAVSDDTSLETVKDYVQLEIVTEGELVMIPETSMMEVVEGEKVELVCLVEDVYPPPDISWSVSSIMVGLLDTSSHGVISPSGITHLVGVQHHVFYTPSHRDHGKNISCMATQGNMSRQVKNIQIMFKTKEMARLGVKENRGFLFLVSVSSVLLVVYSVIVSVVCVRLKMQNQRQSEAERQGRGSNRRSSRDTDLQQSFVEELSTEQDNLKGDDTFNDKVISEPEKNVKNKK